MKIIKTKYQEEPKILRVTKKRTLFKRKDKVLITRKKNFLDIGYGAVIDLSIIEIDDLSAFGENDIIELKNDKIYFLWEYKNDDNCFFLTQLCPLNCIMCPQPPNKYDKELEEKNLRILELIPKKYANSICLTGGEPTSLGNYYLNLISKIRQKFPQNYIITLTSGINFNQLNFLNQFASLKIHSVLAISFTSDIDTIHDEIVGKKGAFYRTHNGIYNLARAKEMIELRIVVSKLNFKRLPLMAEYIYKNYPFLYHIAIMGMEFIGHAKDNYDKIYINPIEYSYELQQCVKKLARYGMNVSIYNIPLCLLDEQIRKFATQSISKWKNSYHKICKKCDLKESCCGVFTTSFYQYENITPIKAITG